ncbi:hypothetical protein E2C01_028173 [Portunus trituberculatus]|uniref:Uncharacterized protein n=1 Tax=Portunus trituberculatus TaxID=210409 RepID=A0A5B7EPB5_PORTR|nr:hypothetical protein [Portunus trituberculatus]
MPQISRTQESVLFDTQTNNLANKAAYNLKVQLLISLQALTLSSFTERQKTFSFVIPKNKNLHAENTCTNTPTITTTTTTTTSKSETNLHPKV